MRQVLCYGDSNTWGSDPADDERRFEWPVRWPGVLQRELGAAYHVVEEGLGSRTTVIDDPLIPHRSGLRLLAPVLETHAPLDLVIVMLGTNDISYAWATAADAADGAAAIAHLVLRSDRDRAAPRRRAARLPAAGRSLHEQREPRAVGWSGREVARAASRVRACRRRPALSLDGRWRSHRDERPRRLALRGLAA